MRARLPDFVLESEAAFYVALPDTNTGACPGDPDPVNGYELTPVFRFWNQRVDSNHRYTSDTRERFAMLAQGYVSEGYGPDGVAFCVESFDLAPWDYVAR